MTQVFISYARQDRRIANGLAERLEKVGLGVWWDTDLLPNENFVEAINQRIDEAKAVIVIWSDDARQSEFVVSEAERARQKKKLVSVSLGDFDPKTLPAPFNLRHTVSAGDLASILAALAKLGVDHQPGAIPDAPPVLEAVDSPKQETSKAKLPRDPTVWVGWLAGFLVALGALFAAVPDLVTKAKDACAAIYICSNGPVIDRNTLIDPKQPIDPTLPM